MPQSKKAAKLARVILSKQRRQLALRGSSHRADPARQQSAASMSISSARPWGASTLRRVRGERQLVNRLAAIAWLDSDTGNLDYIGYDELQPPTLRICLSGDVDAGTLTNPKPILEFWPPLLSPDHSEDDVDLQQAGGSSQQDGAGPKLCLVTDKYRYVFTRNGRYLHPSSVTSAMLLRCSASLLSGSPPASSARTRTLCVHVRSAVPSLLRKQQV